MKIIFNREKNGEGAELEVLKGIDFQEYNFRYLIIESWDFKSRKIRIGIRNINKV